MNTNIIERNNCILCGDNLLFVQVFKNFPVYMGVTDKNEKELTQDMEFCACQKCGCVQLKKLIDPSILYIRPHNPAIGKTWETHNQCLSDYLVSSGAKNILDVGGANMKLANLVCKSPSIVSYTVCDLSAGFYQVENPDKVKIVRDYIENINSDQTYDAVVLSHTLEHFYRPVEVLSRIRKMLNDDGVVVISVPNIEEQLLDGFLNAMNFEHTYYISHEYINFLAEVSGFEVTHRKDFSKYNSFYTLSKSDKTANIPSNTSHARTVYENYIKTVLKDVAQINYATTDKQIYCFGAHIFTQILIACGLNTNCIKGILDNDPNKVGKFLYGTNIKVYNPSVISNDESPIVIVRVAQYKDEIVDSLIANNSSLIVI